jgi:DNA-binding transcriptional LysR family regulator
LTHAGNIIAEEERMLAQARQMAKANILSLSILDTSGTPQLAAIMRELFARLHDDGHHVDVQMRPFYGKTLLEALQDGSIDLGFYYCVCSDMAGVQHLIDAGMECYEVKGYANRLLIGIPHGNSLASRSKLLAVDLAKLEFEVPADAALEHFFTSVRNACRQNGVELNTRLAACQTISDMLINGSDDCATYISSSVLEAGVVPQSVLERMALFDVEDLDLSLCLNFVWKRDSKNPAIELLKSYL